MRRLLTRLLATILLAVLSFYAVCTFGLVYLRYAPPLVTMVQIQHRIEQGLAGRADPVRYTFVPLSRISKHLQHAAVAAEDSRFYQHSGLDWVEIGATVEQSLKRGEVRRGASTITQQLVKNLFLTTHASALRKGAEVPLALLAEAILDKRRILELYLNVAEWGSGIYGAEAAAAHHYGIAAAHVGREQAARLAACLPAPRTRRPERMDRLAAIILQRMRLMGW